MGGSVACIITLHTLQSDYRYEVLLERLSRLLCSSSTTIQYLNGQEGQDQAGSHSIDRSSLSCSCSINISINPRHPAHPTDQRELHPNFLSFPPFIPFFRLGTLRIPQIHNNKSNATNCSVTTPSTFPNHSLWKTSAPTALILSCNTSNHLPQVNGKHRIHQSEASLPRVFCCLAFPGAVDRFGALPEVVALSSDSTASSVRMSVQIVRREGRWVRTKGGGGEVRVRKVVMARVWSFLSWGEGMLSKLVR